LVFEASFKNLVLLDQMELKDVFPQCSSELRWHTVRPTRTGADR